MNIADILKNCPEGTKLYSPIYGDVYFQHIDNREDTDYPIIVKKATNGNMACFAADGRFYTIYEGECMLFPSKDNRDWSTFKSPKKYKFKPFDKVLVRDFDEGTWSISFYGYQKSNGCFECLGNVWAQCIPYKGNEQLLGTTKKSE